MTFKTKDKIKKSILRQKIKIIWLDHICTKKKKIKGSSLAKIIII